MKMKTYQGDTMQEALLKVKEEMGDDAVILKSRKSVRRVNGRNQPCFEVTAALEQDSPLRPSQAATPALPPASDRSAPPERRSPARAGLPGVPERRAPAQPAMPAPASQDWRAGRIPEPEKTYDWRGSLRRVSEDGKQPAPAAPAGRAPSAARGDRPAEPPAPVPAGAGSAQQDLLEMLRSELREVKEKVDMPTRELQVLKKDIKAMIDTVAGLRADTRPRPALPAQLSPAVSAAQAASPASAAPPKAPGSQVQGAGVMDFAAPGSLPGELRPLHAWLMECDVDADLAAELAFASREAPLEEAMAARIRTTGGVRLRPGKPAKVALVGPTGAGKTTTLCKLAALAKMQQGKRVGILSADSFRMGANEQLELFGRTAGIPVRPLFSAADVAPALKEFAHCDLILMDTAGRSHAHPEAWVELQNLLRAVQADEIHLALSTATRMRELIHQAGLYGNLCRLAPACGVVFTKLDECVSLGSLYNLARRLDAPVSYLCDGQVIPDHISLATPRGVAARVLAAGPSQEATLRAPQPAALAG